ncbi:hypothetical protein [Rhodococcus sp. NPDC059234]|uniref:hypothetical protein n=1 Tax=Rhodococcus sp. NPDC059234 TaxID=3346781 RepID=UPI003673132A
MLRNLLRSGASVLVAGALLGGGLALGGGTASAAEAPDVGNVLVSGSADIVNSVSSGIFAMIFGPLELAATSSDSDSVANGCSPKQGVGDCPFG